MNSAAPAIRSQLWHIRQLFLNRSLASKFKIIYIMTILLCMLCNATVIRFFYKNEVRETISALASQTLETISQNADNTIRIISKNSTYLLGSSDIQNYLTRDIYGQNNTRLSRNLRNTLYLTLESMPAAHSIVIIDENGYLESAARYTHPRCILSSPVEADWYEEVHSLQGAPVFLLNGGGYFAPEKDNNYLSLIRLINSTEDARPLGYMIINIPLSELFSVPNVRGNNYSDICVYSGSSPVLDFDNGELASHFTWQTARELSQADKKELVVDNERYLLLGLDNSPLGLQYYSATRFASYANEYKPFLLICLFTVFISTSLFLLIALCTSRFVTDPLYRLSAAMKKTEEGDFHPACVTTHKDEIGLRPVA
ncbi:MAG: cache domain-containing protein [Lachnospiraceae bacterium]|nr:cache domain-containing protein [Lachnospiraceae bacterium]